MENTCNDAGSIKPVAIIILNWNGSELLRRFLPSVVEHSDRRISRIIVADNGSSDDSIEVLIQQFPEVEILRFDSNYGLPKATTAP